MAAATLHLKIQSGKPGTKQRTAPGTWVFLYHFVPWILVGELTSRTQKKARKIHACDRKDMAGHSVLTKSSGARPLIRTDHGRQLDLATQRTCREQEGMSIPFVFVGKKTVSMEKSCRRHCRLAWFATEIYHTKDLAAKSWAKKLPKRFVQPNVRSC